jgi:DNA-binding response OmpR family regulator
MLLKKIVIAEDDDAIAHMINMALGDAGFLCLRASNGEEALNLVRLHTPDLLVLDVMMPRLDGIEVARRLKNDVLLSRTPILMLTALSAVDDKVHGIDAGADAYMVKPFDLRELGAQVKALIRASTRERDRNPTTNLPGSASLDEHISKVLRDSSDVSVAHVQMRDFEAYLDQVGFSQAESLVAMLGQLVLDKVRGHSPEHAFLAHLGGSDFIAVVTREKAESMVKDILSAFEGQRESLDKREDESGRPLCMVIGVAHRCDIATGGMDVISHRVAAALKAAKDQDGSSYVIWQQKA